MFNNDMLMIDLETLSTRPDALILSVGAITFNLQEGRVKHSFKARIDPTSSQAAGAHIEANVVMWWLRQSEKARMDVASPILNDAGLYLPLTEALEGFAKFYSNYLLSTAQVWGNGSDFDNVILRKAYDMAGLKAPWHFRNNRCYRTVRENNSDIEFDRSKNTHNALEDAEAQALHLINIYQAKGHL